MPAATRWYIRTSLVFLLLAFLIAILLAAREPLHLTGEVSALTPVFFHLVFVGFVSQLIFGVVFWLFPKHTREAPRGSEALAWMAYGLLNGGLLLRVLAEPAQSSNPHPIWGWLLVVSAAGQWIAALLFVINTWPRVKER